MIKGCRREIVVVQTQESPVFESAYFILRRKRKGGACPDMVTEANRIISSEGVPRREGRRWPRRVALFLSGFAMGSGFFALLWALL